MDNGSISRRRMLELAALSGVALTGKLGTASAACMADFIVVNMVAKTATESVSVADAMKRAERRAQRYYG